MQCDWKLYDASMAIGYLNPVGKKKDGKTKTMNRKKGDKKEEEEEKESEEEEGERKG